MWLKAIRRIIFIYFSGSITFMKHEYFEIKDNETIIVPSTLKVFVRVSPVIKKQKNRVSELVGMLEEYKKRYTSLSLQKKSRKWWRDVSD